MTLPLTAGVCSTRYSHTVSSGVSDRVALRLALPAAFEGPSGNTFCARSTSPWAGSVLKAVRGLDPMTGVPTLSPCANSRG